MAYEVVWTKEAEISFQQIVDYLTTNFTEKEVTRLVNTTQDKITLIQFNPYSYRKSGKFRNIHYTIILRKTLLVYKIKPRLKMVELIHFWDGRQNPKKFRL